METIALYMRFSGDDGKNRESDSIVNQRELLYNFIQEHDEFVGCNILEFFDDGYSGVDFERPEVKKMLSMAGSVIQCIIVKDNQAFSFTDALLGEGVRYETAGFLQNGRRTWILAKLPQKYIISGDEITPYLVFMNSHDGTGAIKAAMTPIRVVCQNTLNLALSTAKRSWSTNHVGDIQGKLEDAKYTLLYADKYMAELGKAIDQLNQQKLSDRKVYEYIDALFPLVDNASEQQKKNLCRMKEEVKVRYFDAPDLAHVGKNAYRFVNAVSDFATHAKPLRERANYRENLFARTVDGNAMIDKVFDLVKAA